MIADYRWYVILSVKWSGTQTFWVAELSKLWLSADSVGFHVEYKVSLDLSAGLGVSYMPGTGSAKWAIALYVESWWLNQDYVLVLSVCLGQQLLSPALMSYLLTNFLILVVQKNTRTQDRVYELSNVKLIYW